MTAGQLSSADTSNILAIMTAVHDIALNHSGLAWGANRKYEFPTDKELEQSASPFLITTCPDLDRFTQEYQGGSDEMVREMGLVEPCWLINIYAVFPYEAGNVNSWETPLRYAVGLMNAFTIYWGLQETCALANPMKPRVRKFMTRDNNTYMEAVQPIRAYETLLANP